MNASQGKTRIKIRRNSNKSSSTQFSNENQSTKNSLPRSYDGPYEHFPNENPLPNDQQMENHTPVMNRIERNEEDIVSIRSGRITSMERIKVTRTRPNSMAVTQENEQRNKPTISFVPKRPYSRVERLHGEEILPLNNDQYSKTHQSEKEDRR